MGFIYKITNTINNKIYIGQTTKTIEIRFQQHIKNASSHKNTYLYNAMNHYGFKNFKIEQLEYIDNSLLNERERFWISKYHANNKKFGYNMTDGGDNCNTFKYLNKEKYLETCDKISKALTGRKQLKETIEKRIAKLKGKKRTQTQIKNISNSRKNTIVCVKDDKVKIIHINQINEYLANGWKRGARKKTEETKKKISESLKNHIQTNETKNKRSNSISKLQWFNNGEKQGRFKDQPIGWVKGRLTIKFSEKAKNSFSHKGMHVFNNGTINIITSKCPNGFVPGRLNKLKMSKQEKKKQKTKIFL